MKKWEEGKTRDVYITYYLDFESSKWTRRRPPHKKSRQGYSGIYPETFLRGTRLSTRHRASINSFSSHHSPIPHLISNQCIPIHASSHITYKTTRRYFLFFFFAPPFSSAFRFSPLVSFPFPFPVFLAAGSLGFTVKNPSKRPCCLAASILESFAAPARTLSSLRFCIR